MTTDHREGARARIGELVALLRSAGDPRTDAIVAECEALSRAVAAFHMEGIRFRIYNVDRMVQHPPAPLPPDATAIVADVRKHLEAAGFHTRSHQSPT